jgi:hypothetical protein
MWPDGPGNLLSFNPFQRPFVPMGGKRENEFLKSIGPMFVTLVNSWQVCTLGYLAFAVHFSWNS